MENKDLLLDDMDVITSLKHDLIGLLKRIERYVECGTLQSADRELLKARCIGMEMSVDEILTPDWDRITSALGSLGAGRSMPRSPAYLNWLTQPPLRIPTNPATHEAMGAPL